MNTFRVLIEYVYTNVLFYIEGMHVTVSSYSMRGTDTHEIRIDIVYCLPLSHPVETGHQRYYMKRDYRTEEDHSHRREVMAAVSRRPHEE